jgi:Ca-activated chloride channel family protein
MLGAEEFRFANPLWLCLFGALPLLGLWRFTAGRRWRGTLRYSDLNLVEGLGAAPAKLLLVLPSALRIFTLSLLILAMARPQAGQVRRDVLTEGVDIVLVLDCSGSMRETDSSPSRLGAAKEVIAQFIDGRESDRIGLVVFGVSSFTVCPLTIDYAALKDFLGRIRLGVVPEDGTAIGTGLINAVRRLRDSDATSKVIILLTDGDNNQGVEPLEAARIAGDLGIRVYTIGVGTPGYRHSSGGYNPQLLQSVAGMTGGQAFHASDRDALEGIYAQIDEMERSEVEYNVYAQWDELMMWLLWPALLLFAAEIALRQTRTMVVP